MQKRWYLATHPFVRDIVWNLLFSGFVYNVYGISPVTVHPEMRKKKIFDTCCVKEKGETFRTRNFRFLIWKDSLCKDFGYHDMVLSRRE